MYTTRIRRRNMGNQTKLTFTADLLDSDVGPANVLHYTNDGEDYILSANREIDEIALYKVEK